MKKNLRMMAWAALGGALIALSSCAYDPYYTTTTYSSGYGHGYGYGGSSFTTSFLISTGDPRWGYDPYSYSYYDYHRRAYYDPYLYGYYPVGYRPPIVYGVPHPYGWRPGSGYIRPPSRITNVRVTRYQDRESAYRRTNYGWASQVRQGPLGRAESSRSSRDSYRESSRSSPSYRESSQPSSGVRPFGSRLEQQPGTRPSFRQESTRPSRQEGARPQVRSNRIVNVQEPVRPSSFEAPQRQSREPRGGFDGATESSRGFGRPQREEQAPMQRESRGNGRLGRPSETEDGSSQYCGRRF